MKLARINTILLCLIIAINSYLVVMPLLPNVAYWWQDHRASPTATKTLQRKLQSAPIPAENRLLVPAMHLDEPIQEGRDLRALQNGPWRRPATSTPAQGGNTVIVGHRYTYTNPRGTFYYLDRLKVGDEIGIFWQGKKYRYRVQKTAVVKPDTVSVEAPTAGAQLTLYTCTPLWLPKDRLVVTAQLEAPS